MAFAVAISRSKRINMIDDQLNEILDKKDRLDTSHLQLLDEQAQRKEGQKDEATVSPMEAHDKFASAMGEMDVVLDLITNLENARYMDFRVLANKPRSSVSAIQEAVTDRLMRTGRRRAALSAAAERLQRGAAALRAVAACDKTFYTQVTALQRYWRIRVNPSTTQYAGAPFSAEIAFAEPNASAAVAGSGAAGSSAQGGAQVRQGSQQGGDASASGLAAAQQLTVSVPLYKDPVTGVVRIQLEVEEGADAVAARSSFVRDPSLQAAGREGSRPPSRQGPALNPQLPEAEGSWRAGSLAGAGPSTSLAGAGAAGAGEAGGPKVVVGVRAVHKELMQLQQRLLWQVAARSLEADAAAGAAASPFMYSLARKVIARSARAPSPTAAMATDAAAGAVAQAHSAYSSTGRMRPHPWDFSADMLTLRPLTLEHTVSCRVPSASIPPQPRPYVMPLHALPLLPDLAAAISHAHFRHQLRAQLEMQAYQLVGVTLHWVPTTRAATSAVRVHVAPHANFLVTVQDSMVEVEGVGLGGGGAATRWAKDSVVNVQRTELPGLLYWLAGLSQGDGVPMEDTRAAQGAGATAGAAGQGAWAGQGTEAMELI